MSRTAWIAVDWGTSSLRAWGIAPDGAVTFRVHSDRGMSTLSRDGFEPALLDLIGPHLPVDRVTSVRVCGMAGSRQGWAEAPYVSVPCAPPDDGQAVAVETNDPRLSVAILPGVKQTDPADVMRGEETQIAGFLALNPGWDGVICLPGTHSKWAHLSASEIVSFRTVMTGELFSLISKNSVLKHSIGSDGWDAEAFDEALSDTLSRPEYFSGRLFSLRAESLLGAPAPGTARARLSGWLIGLELAATRPYWLGQQVALIGADGLVPHYARALEAQGVVTIRTDAERMTIEGLRAAGTQDREAAE